MDITVKFGSQKSSDPVNIFMRDLERPSKSQPILKQSGIIINRETGIVQKFIYLFSISIAASLTQAHSQLRVTPSVPDESWFDQIVGIENSGIINGPEYKMEMLGA